MRAPSNLRPKMPRSRTNDRPRRRTALRAGHLGEVIAGIYLRCKGYRVLARGFLVRGGEIDLIVQRGETVAFVEVKLRATLEEALIAISPDKRRRMARAAHVFIARRQLDRVTLRADALYLAPWRWPRHIPAAFELEL